MKNILALVGLAVVLFVGLGWYLEWYKIGSTPAPDGHRTFNVDINAQKIIDDEKKAQKKVTDLLNNDPKGTPGPRTGVTPVPPTPENKGDVQTTGFQFNSDGSISIIPPYKNINK